MSLTVRCNNSKREGCRAIWLPGSLMALLSVMTGCNGLPGSTATPSGPAAKPGPQKYMAPVVLGAPGGSGVTESLQSYTVDDTARTFEQVTYSLRLGGGQQINNSGSFSVLDRNLLGLATTYTDPTGTSGSTLTPPQTGGWAVELAGQAGGLIQLPGQPFTPLVAASACPGGTAAQTYQFVTVPSPLLLPSTAGQTVDLTFNPAVETGYGSVSVSGNGSAVTLNSIAQHTLPAVKGTTGTPANASPASATGTCSSTVYGETISVPGQVFITDPGNGQTVPASATIGIGPTGLLVENNGALNNVAYQNALGAGTGAVGLPRPAAPLDTSAIVGAQYLGFFYGGGISGTSTFSPSGWTSSLASFGFPSAPATCAAVAAPTATLIYGGDFNNNDASTTAVQSAGGFGNCDFAIDLGVQDSANNGLYPAATVWVGASFSGNTTGTSYSFPAVAVAGQLGGKYAIFLLGVDTTGSPKQAQGIYLLQSN